MRDAYMYIQDKSMYPYGHHVSVCMCDDLRGTENYRALDFNQVKVVLYIIMS